MTQTNDARRAAGAAGLGKLSFPGENDNQVYPKSGRDQAKNTVIDAPHRFRRAPGKAQPGPDSPNWGECGRLAIWAEPVICVKS
jgi:hypothetical protein